MPEQIGANYIASGVIISLIVGATVASVKYLYREAKSTSSEMPVYRFGSIILPIFVLGSYLVNYKYEHSNNACSYIAAFIISVLLSCVCDLLYRVRMLEEYKSMLSETKPFDPDKQKEIVDAMSSGIPGNGAHAAKNGGKGQVKNAAGRRGK